MFAARNMVFAGSAEGAIPRVITGNAYPGETLTSTRAGQWYADGLAISGETAATYLVRLSDIGKAITQTGSNTLTIWHPRDVPQVRAFWTAGLGVMTSIVPDVAATEGQVVSSWVDQIAGYRAAQTSATSKPLYRATAQNGNPTIQFDGANDFLVCTDAGLMNYASNVPMYYLIIGILDDASGGTPVSIGGGAANLFSRHTGGLPNNQSSRNFGSVVSAFGTALGSNYCVLAAHVDAINGNSRVRQNGVVTGSTSYGGSSNTSVYTVPALGIGATSVGTLPDKCNIAVAMIVSGTPTATNLSRLERFIGLHGNLNIPIV